jgi:hypothetical protein
MCRYLICMVLLISTFSSLKATTLRGNAKDAKSGEELVGANIYIKELKRGTISGLDGSFVMKDVPKGNYTISCSYISYQTFEIKISLNENDVQILDFGLNLATEEIDQVTVVASKEQNT